MSEGYQFQVNVWQPSPDMGPVVERQMTLDKVVTLEPGWQATQIAKARAEGKTAFALQSLCSKYGLNHPDEDAARDGRRPAAARKRHRRSLIAIAACWQHIGFDACDGEHEAKYDTLLCSDIFDWLGIDRAKPTSHGTRRPACMVGAVAAYLDRHPNNRPLVHRWCFEYQKICGTKGEGISYVCTVGLYDRIARKDSTKGKEKTRVFFNTYMSLKAYCNGQPTPAFSDPPEPLKDLVDPTKA